MFSIIIPVYNCEKYILNCINSIQQQTFSEWEVIIVDDGSTDNTWETLSNIAQKDNRMRILSQQQKGVSAARNYGLSVAKNKYIMFCDADDWWDNRLLEKCIENLEGINCLVFGIIDDYFSLDGDIISSHAINISQKQTEDLNLIDDYFEIFNSGLMASACNKVYKKCIIDDLNIKFDEMCTVQEDYKFNFEYLINQREIRFLHDNLYHYRHLEGDNNTLKRKFKSVFYNARSFYNSVSQFTETVLHIKCERISIFRNNILELYHKEICAIAINEGMEVAFERINLLSSDSTYKTLLKYSDGKFYQLIRCLFRVKARKLVLYLLIKRYKEQREVA